MGLLIVFLKTLFQSGSLNKSQIVPPEVYSEKQHMFLVSRAHIAGYMRWRQDQHGRASCFQGSWYNQYKTALNFFHS